LKIPFGKKKKKEACGVAQGVGSNFSTKKEKRNVN
jgi:hypothetical protein